MPSPVMSIYHMSILLHHNITHMSIINSHMKLRMIACFVRFFQCENGDEQKGDGKEKTRSTHPELVALGAIDKPGKSSTLHNECASPPCVWLDMSLSSVAV